MTRLRILALEPYLALSHRVFLEGWTERSRHEVLTWSLPARKWKWRMRGGALRFAERARGNLSAPAPDLVFASDYLDLCQWRALAPPGYRDLPVILYFHENQATYPLGAAAPEDHHPGWVNVSSALAAERVLFNSRWHRESFIAEVRRVLALMPDEVPEEIPGSIERRSSVFPVGLDFALHRCVRAEERRPFASEPVLLWNHRWERDKGSDILRDALLTLAARRVPFRLVLLGQSFAKTPPEFADLLSALGERVLHSGYVEDRRTYLEWLSKSDIVISTARHEFFGVSIVEAMFLGCLPVLPRALSYPEIVPADLHETFLYDSPERLPRFLEGFLADPPIRYRSRIEAAAEVFDWRTLAPRLDGLAEETWAEGRGYWS